MDGFDMTQALEEGWCIIENSDGLAEIQRDDDDAAARFDSDEAAERFVKDQAVESQYHRKALRHINATNADTQTPGAPDPGSSMRRCIPSRSRSTRTTPPTSTSRDMPSDRSRFIASFSCGKSATRSTRTLRILWLCWTVIPRYPVAVSPPQLAQRLVWRARSSFPRRWSRALLFAPYCVCAFPRPGYQRGSSF